MALQINSLNSSQKRGRKEKVPSSELIKYFWEAPPEAVFPQGTISVVIDCRIKTLECNRWRGKGIPFRKVAGRVLYRKSDVIAYLESHALVNSTSEYKTGGATCQK